MSENAIVESKSSVIEQVLMVGDLSRLSPEQRVNYYMRVCDSVGLNPYTKPFDYLQLNGKLVLYAKKDATDQLRRANGVSITKLERDRIEGVYTVTAYAQDKSGRTDSSIGAVNVEGLKGDMLANALMKAETKAKRRVTLSICGLGMLDETEVETIPNAQTVTVTIEQPAQPPAPAQEAPAMTIEEAEAEFSPSQNMAYGAIETEQLTYMLNRMLKAKQPTDDQVRKIEAVKVILEARANGRQIVGAVLDGPTEEG